MRKKTFATIIWIVVFACMGFILIQALRFAPVAWQLIFNKNIDLKKTDERINILLLGIGGGEHEGPNLTDTILFASIDPVSNKVTLVSIPRDLWVPDLSAKLNTAYAFGEEKQKGGGITLTRAVVAKILNQPVNYVVRVDFDGFIKAIDLMGGIDVDVEQSFDDYEYPIAGKEADTCGHTEEEVSVLATSSSILSAFPCRYMHLHFDKGLTHMDGKTALMFVRSRHALGSEGTDFARSKRQEKVINAVKAKVFTLGVLFNPVKVLNLYSTVAANVDTNIKQDEFDDFIRLAQKMKNGTTQSVVLDFGDESVNREGLLVNPPVTSEYQNQWVLIPRIGNGSFSEIQKYVDCVIKGKTCTISPQ